MFQFLISAKYSNDPAVIYIALTIEDNCITLYTRDAQIQPGWFGMLERLPFISIFTKLFSSTPSAPSRLGFYNDMLLTKDFRRKYSATFIGSLHASEHKKLHAGEDASIDHTHLRLQEKITPQILRDYLSMYLRHHISYDICAEILSSFENHVNKKVENRVYTNSRTYRQIESQLGVLPTVKEHADCGDFAPFLECSTTNPYSPARLYPNPLTISETCSATHSNLATGIGGVATLATMLVASFFICRQHRQRQVKKTQQQLSPHFSPTKHFS